MLFFMTNTFVLWGFVNIAAFMEHQQDFGVVMYTIGSGLGEIWWIALRHKGKSSSIHSPDICNLYNYLIPPGNLEALQDMLGNVVPPFGYDGTSVEPHIYHVPA